MPELPEVEVTRLGLAPLATGRTILHIIIRDKRLRVPIADDLPDHIIGKTVSAAHRRGKYLILELAENTEDNNTQKSGALLFHLGMSGSLRVVTQSTPAPKHTHLEILFDDNTSLRLHDPRRFGLCLYSPDWSQEPMLTKLGIEPLAPDFNGHYLAHLAQKRTSPIKTLLMEPQVVVGIGNIYANESLFLAGIHPHRKANRVSTDRYHRLAQAIQQTLEQAIQAGGSTLQDFSSPTGQPGYFSMQFSVYGKAGEKCPKCEKIIKKSLISNRSTFYCPTCQR